jgi:hypothetical protein
VILRRLRLRQYCIKAVAQQIEAEVRLMIISLRNRLKMSEGHVQTSVNPNSLVTTKPAVSNWSYLVCAARYQFEEAGLFSVIPTHGQVNWPIGRYHFVIRAKIEGARNRKQMQDKRGYQIRQISALPLFLRGNNLPWKERL